MATHKIIDDQGRVGQVTEVRSNGVFARPVNTPLTIDNTGEHIGFSGGKLITSTFWHRTDAGNHYTLRGLWFDSPLHAFRPAKFC